MKITAIACARTCPSFLGWNFFFLGGGGGGGGQGWKVEHNMVFINHLSDRTSRLGLILKGTQSFLTRAILSIILCVWGGGGHTVKSS